MADKQVFVYLRIVHGLFNIALMLAFIVQAWLGLQIRKQRKAGNAPPLSDLKRHRSLGPVLVPAGVLGFLSGCGLIYADYGYLLKYPLHFITGLVIALLLLATYPISREIRAGESPWRERHYRLGLLTLGLYGFQAFLGIGILF
jgi:hypothetical protein